MSDYLFSLHILQLRLLFQQRWPFLFSDSETLALHLEPLRFPQHLLLFQQ